MDKLVIDPSALLAVLLGEEHRDDVIAASRGADLLAPSSLPWEVGNALVAMGRRHRLQPEHVRLAVERSQAVPVRLEDVPLAEATALAVEEGIYAYDAYVLWLAEHHAVPLLSLDLRLRAVARRRGVVVVPEHVAGDERHG